MDSLTIDRTTIASDWHARGFSCGLWIDHGGREWTYQAQETDELFMMMSGELELEIGGETFQPAIGEEIRILAGMSHAIRNTEGKTARWFYGQQRETISAPQNPKIVQERSFHPDLKRKRRSEKKVANIEVLKEF